MNTCRATNWSGDCDDDRRTATPVEHVVDGTLEPERASAAVSTEDGRSAQAWRRRRDRARRTARHLREKVWTINVRQVPGSGQETGIFHSPLLNFYDLRAVSAWTTNRKKWYNVLMVQLQSSNPAVSARAVHGDGTCDQISRGAKTIYILNTLRKRRKSRMFGSFLCHYVRVAIQFEVPTGTKIISDSFYTYSIF